MFGVIHLPIHTTHDLELLLLLLLLPQVEELDAELAELRVVVASHIFHFVLLRAYVVMMYYWCCASG